MNNKESLLKKLLYAYLLAGPFVDILTSIAVHSNAGGITMGVVVRFLFAAAMTLYVLFVYQGKHKIVLRLAVIVTTAYGVVYLLNSLYINGLVVLFENAKMFVKTYFFVYVLLGLYALYQEHHIIVSDKLLTALFGVYSASILLAAITGTSFHTYYWQQIGYCGWFYAGNEIGAIVAILAGAAMMYAFTHCKYFWAAVLGLIAFSSTYIGTKVPFFAIVAVAVLLMLFWIVNYFVKNGNHGKRKIIKYGILLVCIVVLYQMNSPVKQLTAIANGNYENAVSTTEPTVFDETTVPQEDTSAEQTDEATTPQEDTSAEQNGEGTSAPEKGDNNKSKKVFLALNWLLSNRLTNIEHVVERYSNGTLSEKLFGIGYIFKIGEKLASDVVEMDFVSIFLKHGIIGAAVHIAPIIYFAVLCIIKLFKRIKKFWELENAFVYTYSILIGLGCAFVAGHVLVAPAVSVYIAIFIVKLYACLTDE